MQNNSTDNLSINHRLVSNYVSSLVSITKEMDHDVHRHGVALALVAGGPSVTAELGVRADY